MRLKLWEEFNNCWLGLFQKQFDMVEDMKTTGHRPQAPQSIIEYDFIEKMGSKLVKNCDNMEKHGLVDYQMGVWEEEITASACNCIAFSSLCFKADQFPVLMKCLGQLEELGAGSSSAQRPTASGSRRR